MTPHGCEHDGSKTDDVGPVHRADDSERRNSDHSGWAAHVETMAVGDLRRLAVSLPIIEQAKGVMMARFGCNATTAFAVLRRLSSTRNTKLRDIAARVIEIGSSPTAERFEALTRFVNQRPDNDA